MITIRKLSELPPRTRLRKISRLLRQLEFQLRGLPSPDTPAWLLDAAECADTGFVQALFSMVAVEPKLDAPLKQRCLDYCRLDGTDGDRMIRAMNDIHHGLEHYLGHTVADWDFFTGGELDGRTRRTAHLYLYLDDLRSPFNVGAVFRAADSFGVCGIFLSPGTASPDHTRAARSSMGAVSVIPWWRAEISEAVDRVRTAVCEPLPAAGAPDQLRVASSGGPCAAAADGLEFGIFAVETGGTALSEFPFPAAGMAVIGSEELGVGPEALELARASSGRVSIPMAGAKGSLNVAVATGIVLYQWWRAVDVIRPSPRG
jgi:RNA methyltransferase, TrmH family